MTRFLINLTEELKFILKQEAKNKGQTLNGLIRQILWEWVKTQKEEKK